MWLKCFPDQNLKKSSIFCSCLVETLGKLKSMFYKNQIYLIELDLDKLNII